MINKYKKNTKKKVHKKYNKNANDKKKTTKKYKNTNKYLYINAKWKLSLIPKIFAQHSIVILIIIRSRM